MTGAMHAEYQVPTNVPDVPATPGIGPDLPEMPPDPTQPGGDPEPRDVAER